MQVVWQLITLSMNRKKTFDDKRFQKIDKSYSQYFKKKRRKSIHV